MAQHRRLLLRTGNGQPELLVHLQRAKPATQAGQVLCNLRLAQRLEAHLVEPFGHGPLGQQLHGTHAIAANGLQQRERIGPAQPEALVNAPANALAVRQQVVEIVGHHLARHRQVAGEGHGQ